MQTPSPKVPLPIFGSVVNDLAFHPGWTNAANDWLRRNIDSVRKGSRW